MNGVCALIKRDPAELPSPLPPNEDSEKSAVYNPEEGLRENLTMLAPY